MLGFADCTPLLFYDPIKNVIANTHSGWKGTLQTIGVKTVEKMMSEYECKAKDIICCIGPHIRKCHFEVDADVKELSPINGKAPFGTRIDFKNDRKITALPLELNENIKINPKTNTLNITLDTSDDQITDTIYIRFLYPISFLQSKTR